MKHASDPIMDNLSKMHPDHAAEIRRIAGSDTTSTTILGANRPAGQIDMPMRLAEAQWNTNHEKQRLLDRRRESATASRRPR